MRLHLTCPNCFARKTIKLKNEGDSKKITQFQCTVCGKKWTKEFALDKFYKTIKEIDFEIGSWDAPNQVVKINFNTNLISCGLEEMFSPSDLKHFELEEKDLRSVRKQIKENIHLLEWKKNFFAYDISDGIQWEIKISFNTGMKTYVIFGSNLYPKQWNNLDLLFKMLTKETYKPIYNGE